MNAPRVMVVEDERIVALNLCSTLNKLGYRASPVASSGEEALRFISEQPPDIVLMDIRIDGGMDGIETASRIPLNLMVPVIYLTAYSDDETLGRAGATRPYGYLLKPFSERELNATIRMALDKRKSDMALRVNQERLRMALTAAEMGSWEVDVGTGHILYKDHAGWSSDAVPRVMAESFREFLPTVHEADRDRVRDAFDSISNSAESCEIEFRRPDESGTLRWFRVVGKSVRSEDDRRRRIVGVVRDITEAKRADQARHASEQGYRDIISTINGIVWEADHRKKALTYVSDSSTRILGYTPAVWMADPLFWEQHLHPADASRAIAQYQASTNAGLSYESTYRMIASSGETVWIHEAVSTISHGGEPDILRGVMVDVTSLKKAEHDSSEVAARLAESETRLAAILDTAAIGIVTVGDDLRILSFNREAERIFGYKAEAMIGQMLDRLLPTDFIVPHRTQMTEFLTTEIRSRSMGDWRTVSGLAADGRIIPLATIISKVTVAGKSTMTAIMRDMTEAQRTEEELRRLLKDRELAVARAEAANVAKSSFLAVMSHELRTPLNAILGFSELMVSEIKGPMGNDAYLQYAADIHESGALLLTIVNSLLDLTRIESGKYDFNINRMSLIDAWVPIERTLTANASAKGIELRAQDPMPDIAVTADLNAVSQILINLVSNAIKFTPAGGAIEVGIESGESAGTGGRVDGAQRSANAIFVRDNGRGIPADKVTEVLKPFVQVSDAHTRDTGGVGLGLAICNSLATAMAGRIEIESELGKGTTVRVFLPVAGEK